VAADGAAATLAGLPAAGAGTSGTRAGADAGTAVSVFGAAATGRRDSTGAGVCSGPAAQAARLPRIASFAPTAQAVIPARAMWLLIVEAAAALALLVFIVWWTMFSGRPKGEPPPDDDKA